MTTGLARVQSCQSAQTQTVGMSLVTPSKARAESTQELTPRTIRLSTLTGVTLMPIAAGLANDYAEQRLEGRTLMRTTRMRARVSGFGLVVWGGITCFHTVIYINPVTVMVLTSVLLRHNQ